MLKNNGFHNRHSPILRAFSPLSLFSGGAPGAWYDPSDLTTLFQDSAGTTPVTAVEQPVGLMLDKSQGLVLGSELGNNANWVAFGGASVSVVGTTVTVSDSSGSVGYQRAYQDIATVAGKWYTFSGLPVSTTDSRNILALNIWNGAFGSVLFSRNGIAPGSVFSCTFLATGTTTRIDLVEADPPNTTIKDWVWSNISVKELPGNHAFQATSASRPVLSSRVNKLLATATLATQSVTTRATAHTLRFEGAGSVTLTGTAIGVYTAGTHSITTTAGTLTLTVLGSVTSADLRETNDGVGVPAYQAVVTSTNYATTGFLPYLKFDGVDDSLSTNSISFTSTDKMSVFAGVRKLSDAARAILVELSTSYGDVGTFGIDAPLSPTNKDYRFVSGGSLAAGGVATGNGFVAPITNVVTGLGNISGDLATLRVNGAQIAQGTGDQGTGNFGNYPIFIGRRGGTSLPFNGQLYSMIIVGKAVTAGELSSTETYVNQKTGAY